MEVVRELISLLHTVVLMYKMSQMVFWEFSSSSPWLV